MSATSARKASANNGVTPLMLIRSSPWLLSGSPASRISEASRCFASATFHGSCRVSSRQTRLAAWMFNSCNISSPLSGAHSRLLASLISSTPSPRRSPGRCSCASRSAGSGGSTAQTASSTPAPPLSIYLSSSSLPSESGEARISGWLCVASVPSPAHRDAQLHRQTYRRRRAL